jgi:hypothetical protein
MSEPETVEIFYTAERLFNKEVLFEKGVIDKISECVHGYPYFAQLLGKECVTQANYQGKSIVDLDVFSKVLDDIKTGRAFPTLEAAYQRAIGLSADREIILHLLAEQEDENALFNNTEIGRVLLKKTRRDAEEFDIQYVDQLIPRLVDPSYGPVLKRIQETQGVYEFVNPVLRLYTRLRSFSY